MFKQASVSDLISGKISRDKGHIVITMRRYPRFVRKELRDEYLITLSPDRKLFEDWIGAKRRPSQLRSRQHPSNRAPTDEEHEVAFNKVKFEERFDLPPEGYLHLERLRHLKQDVYFICQCHPGKRCHREMLLILARKVLNARAETPKNKYPRFEKRLPMFKKKWKSIREGLIPGRK